MDAGNKIKEINGTGGIKAADAGGRVERMKKEALHELLHDREKDIKRQCRDIVKKVAGRYVPPKDCIFWDTGLLANGLMETAGDGETLEAVRQYFDRWMKKGMPVSYVDDTLCGVALLRLYRATMEEKYRSGADRMADYLLALAETEADGAGSIPYRHSQKNGHVYVDGIGMMCPFLARYGVETGRAEAVRLAVTQIENMLAYGMDEKTGLPYHGFRYENRVKYGIIGWGRAVGWLFMGMKGVLEQLGGTNAQRFLPAPEYGKLERAFTDLLKAVSPYQREDGGFSWQLEAMEGPADSSATAMIAQALHFAVMNGMAKGTEWEKMLRSAALFLCGCEKDGKVYRCLGECMGFSQYPQVYGAYPWSLGTALEVIGSGYGV